MIVFRRVWKDLVLHFVIVYVLLSIFPHYFSHTEFVFVSLVASLLLTLINHVFLPWLRLAAREDFQGCTLRWGMPPSSCPFRASCPHRPTCDFARDRAF